MLLRAYRFTDKLGVLILKSGLALTDVTLEGVGVITAAGRRLLGGLLLLLLGIGRILYLALRQLVVFILAVFRRVFAFASGTARVGMNTARRASGTVGTNTAGVMARRAARAELEATLTEDPLKAQNRLLSIVTLALLAGLIGVVLWATSPARSTGASLPVVSGNQNLSFVPSTQQATSAAIMLSTPVPTATTLLPVLEVRGSMAFTVRERGQQDIWVVAVGSRTPLRLTNSPADDRDPAWSPDGRRLAYASRQDGNWEIYVYELATGTSTRLTYDLSFQGAPQWSPDGLWLVYESYQGNNLDIYVVPVDGSQPAQRVTDSPAPDFSPSWSPDGRRIAFVSWRDGNQDIYVFSLDNPADSASVNLTNTPQRQEDYPAWSPDGRLLAFSALDQGVEKVFVKPSDDPQAAAQVMGRGRTPSWAPNGASLVYAVDSLEGTQLMAEPFTEAGLSAPVIGLQLPASDPVWTGAPLPPALVNSGGVGLGVAQALFTEQDELYPDGLYRLQPLLNVTAPIPNLSDRVNDSFIALRRQVTEQAGWDFLGRLEDAFWDLNRQPSPGEERRNWLMTGRAFAVDRQLIQGFPPQLEMVREDLETDTYWRVYVRVADEAQSGQLGEPLRRMPWDILSRNSGDVEAYDQGGRLRAEVPEGYYIDFTQIASDYGWERVPAGSDWRANFNGVNYWLFRKPDGLAWCEAMLELYNEGQLINFCANPTPTPQS